MPTTQESDKQRIPFHAFPTQQSSTLPGVPAQEDSVNPPSPIGVRIPGGWPIEGPVTNSELPTDAVASTPEEEGQYTVFVNGDGLTLLQYHRRTQNSSLCSEDSQPTPLRQNNWKMSSGTVLLKETGPTYNPTTQ